VGPGEGAARLQQRRRPRRRRRRGPRARAAPELHRRPQPAPRRARARARAVHLVGGRRVRRLPAQPPPLDQGAGLRRPPRRRLLARGPVGALQRPRRGVLIRAVGLAVVGGLAHAALEAARLLDRHAQGWDLAELSPGLALEALLAALALLPLAL